MSENIKLLMGNEAIGLGAIRAGVKMVAGYPGTPSTEILETIAKHNDGSIHVEWSVNEKAAMEVGAGAAYAGARSLVTMKQVGLNVASDPLMSLAYIGVKGGMVIVSADDPGPISSQTEQDTRLFGQFSKLPVFDPTSPEEAYEMIGEAFEYSEKYQTPVLFRPTTRVCHGRASIKLLPKVNVPEPEGFVKDTSRWVIFPRLSYANHQKIEDRNVELSRMFSEYRRNAIEGVNVSEFGNASETKNAGATRNAGAAKNAGVTKNAGTAGNACVSTNLAIKLKKGVAVGGVSYAYTKEVLSENVPLLKIVTPHPFPEELALDFLESVDEVLVLEELEPVIERALLLIVGKYHLPTIIKGKLSRDTIIAGENSVESISKDLTAYLGVDAMVGSADAESISENLPVPPLPIRPPVLCAGCPHRASFYAVKKAMKGKKAVFSGDIGCYTLGNAKPLDMVDTCLCMGADVTIAQGLHIMEPDAVNFAFIGDSTFFASGITGVINAVYNQTDIVLVILDNSTTAMTGHQPHPGTGVTMMSFAQGVVKGNTAGNAAAGNEAATGNENSAGAGSVEAYVQPTEIANKISIENILKGIGVADIVKANPLNLDEAVAAVQKVENEKGVRVILFQSPCIAVSKQAKAFAVNQDTCVNCKVCISQLGCPAIAINNGKVVIESSLCFGCGLCAQVCPTGAIAVDNSVAGAGLSAGTDTGAGVSVGTDTSACASENSIKEGEDHE